jgi:hypothetical protein
MGQFNGSSGSWGPLQSLAEVTFSAVNWEYSLSGLRESSIMWIDVVERRCTFDQMIHVDSNEKISHVRSKGRAKSAA